ncbi:MAG: aminoacyl-tRNA hydrolase [Boseongicola sp. SB0673_bin_14]|nr:aminoacyl-tRNA hydrolase [Boseongicola sp. SB0667_bin_21]MYI67255.1 aminoacyl-tRNA hydrolase [Boseongicola sp. SB0673_bin_14]
MKLFVGLGNPGPRYAGHRHNVGYMVVDRIAADHGFGGWRSKFQGQVSEARLGSDKVMLLKPETFMNESGRAVGEAQRFHKLATEDVVVFHDEIDLAPGKMRLKRGGGHAGHNGLRSIDAHIGNDYHRVRIGVGHPGRRDAVHVHVLKDFSKADQAWLEELLTGISDGAAFLAKGDVDRFRNSAAVHAARAAETPDTAPRRPAPVSASPVAGDDRSALQKLLDRFRR